ncbi:MAG: DUF1501 domain-containing protein [Deltaproteobacteria bacterium]|nr:DUF1501 domain-containing protein [Deltaproteobacteria bacterium]
MSGITRRGFLSTSLFAGLGAAAATFGGAAALRRLARAASSPIATTSEDRYYIFLYFSGGWDQLLALDPRDPAVFGNAQMATTRIQPAYELTNAVGSPLRDALGDGSMMLGPFVGELAQQAHRIAVIRGMSMDTLTHEVGRRRFLTGRPPSGLSARGSSTDTWLAARLGEAEPIPNLALNMESYNKGDLPTYASALRTASFEDLLRALRADGTPDALIERELDALLAESAACPGAQASPFLVKTEAARGKARDMVTGGLDRLFDFAANTPEMIALRARYGINGTSTAALSSAGARAALAATAIMGGVARVVSVTINPAGLDTHFANWQTDHGPNLQAGMTAAARLIDHLATSEHPDGSGDSWLDRTVVVGFSEFSRTPLVNPNGGRDHWLTNSCFVAGGNVRGGRVIGASSNNSMLPLPVDLETGRACTLDDARTLACPDEPGVAEIVKPEHVLQTLYHEIGVTDDSPDLRVRPLRALLW